MKVAPTSLASARMRPQYLLHLLLQLMHPKQPCTSHTKAAEFWTRAHVAEQFEKIQGTKTPVQEMLTSPSHKLQSVTCTERVDALPCPALSTFLPIWSINNWGATPRAAGGTFCAQLSSSSVSPHSPCADLFLQPFFKKPSKEGKKPPNKQT